MVIYAIVHVRTGRAYIGRTNRPARRWYEHQRDLRLGCHESKALQTAWNEDGAECFTFVTLETLDSLATKEQAAEREKWHLTSTQYPYNQSRFTLSGPAPGYQPPPSVGRNISAALKGRKKPEGFGAAIRARKLGVPNPAQRERMLGRTAIVATKENMRIAHLGLTASPESRAKRSATLTGRVFTQAWKDKIRDAKTGVPWSLKRRAACLPQVIEAEGVRA